MDVVLDLYETYIGDHVYARLLPAHPPPYDADLFANTTIFPFGLECEYKPPTKYFTVRPSPAVCQSAWARDNILRQSIDLFLLLWIFGMAVYFLFSTLSYVFIFDKQQQEHPRYLKNQVRLEIQETLWALPGMSLLTLPLVLAEVRGHTKMYDTVAEGPGLWYEVLQFPLFLLFTDFCIYWIHRGLHHPLIYKNIHKKHHKWVVPTPFAAYAFHPADGWGQSLPYHVFTFIFPMNKFSFLVLFVFVVFWTILIHDGEYLADNPVINGAACHTIHHLYFNYNYGQYTTLWDRIGGSHRVPDREMFDRAKKNGKTEWERQNKGVEDMILEVEGQDDRVYSPEELKKNK
ncbi:uncharacterized protein G6M90_00g071150 [Metarhizium brunneum]|uniref:Fatty acid hydroxylase domain-containing protein n=1 Tax=Metarhizium brunneum TaxID=500148 RepID=A0A7D5UZT7_9HYPO